MGLFDLFREQRSARLVDSSLMPFAEALDVVGCFGSCVAELNDPQRTLSTIKKDGSNSIPFSLSLGRLAHSKEKIQTAIAVAIAGLIVASEVGSSPWLKKRLIQVQAVSRGSDVSEQRQIEYLIHIIWNSSGDLAWFTRKPVFPPVDSDSPFCKGWSESQNIYARWAEICKKVFKEKAGERSQPLRNGLPSPRALVEYWRDIDSQILVLLKYPALAAIRET